MNDDVSIRVSGSGPAFVPTRQTWNVFTDEQLAQRDRETAARAWDEGAKHAYMTSSMHPNPYERTGGSDAD